MDEIQGLNSYQASALLELYDHGLKGIHLREWYVQNKDKKFCDKCLEKLLKLHFENNLKPTLALKQVNGIISDMSAVARKINKAYT